jgi:phosphohistidine swiveling domain-containing protein
VPPGVIVLDVGWRSAIDRGLLRIDGGGARQTISVPDPTLLVHLLGLPAFDGSLVVRAAFSVADDSGESIAGAFATGLFVDGRRAPALAAGLAGVWASALGRPAVVRRDLIIQSMVIARRAGVAFTESEHEDDLVNATEGTAERLLAGTERGDSFTLPRRRGLEGPTERDAVAGRLQTLLRDVRRALGEHDWHVEWADDGRRMWLVRVRAIRRPTRRNETFTAAGHREVLPDPPSRFTTSLIASRADRLFGAFQALDPGLPARRPLVEVFRGRPFINLSLVRETLRRWGLPTRMVTESVGAPVDREFGTCSRRLLRRGRVLLGIGRLHLSAVAAARQAAAELEARAERPVASIAAAVEGLKEAYLALAGGMISLAAASAPALFVLRRAGVRTGMSGRAARGAGATMLAELAPLHGLGSRPGVRPALERGELPDDDAFRSAFASWLSRHGHRGVYESDVARPRYREEPAPLLRSLTTGPLAPAKAPPASLRQRLLAPLVWHVTRTEAAREDLRSAAMVAYERLRAAILDRARALARDGLLPSPEAIWQLEVDEVARLDEGFRPGADFWRARATEVASARDYDFPDVFRRFDDLEAFRVRREPVSRPGKMRGMPLTHGTARGRAWVLTAPSVDLPAGLQPEETILVARAVDWGWLPTFSRVAGVVVELGGDLTHGSIVLREVGLPAITGVQGATLLVRTGERLVLRTDEGVVERARES